MPGPNADNHATILVIDNSPHFRKLLREALALEGYEVLEPAEGRDGVRLYGLHRPNVVLLDMIMPEKDGIETLREILRVPNVLTTHRHVIRRGRTTC